MARAESPSDRSRTLARFRLRRATSITVFLSHPRPASGVQRAFLDALTAYLVDREFVPRTLGITDYDMNAPLTAIRRLLLESNGVLTVALRRILIVQGELLASREYLVKAMRYPLTRDEAERILKITDDELRAAGER